VRLEDAGVGDHAPRRPVGLLLVALSCLGGAAYAQVVATRRREPREPSHAKR
jgi:hypothetical protein